MDGDFLVPEASRYLQALLPPPDPVMARLLDEIQKEGQPAVNPQTGALLAVLVSLSGGRRVLEVGTNVGFGCLWMARGLARGGILESIEIDPAMARRARENLAEAGLGGSATIHEGAALDVLPRLPAGAYDLVFLDCVKSEYPAYLDHALRLLRPGGVVAADNVLWHGNVWSRAAHDPDTEGIRRYTERALADPRLRTTLVPTGDGLAVSVLLRA